MSRGDGIRELAHQLGAAIREGRITPLEARRLGGFVVLLHGEHEYAAMSRSERYRLHALAKRARLRGLGVLNR